LQSSAQTGVTSRALIVRALADDQQRYSNAVFEVRFQFPPDDYGKKIVLKLLEVKEKNGKKSTEPVKDAKGEELSFAGILDFSKTPGVLVLNMSEGQGLAKQVSFEEPGKPRVGFSPDSVDKTPFFLGLPDFRTRRMCLQTEVDEPMRKSKAQVTSPTFEVASHFVIDNPDLRTYDWDEGNTVSFYSNSSEGPKGDEKDEDGNYGAFYDILDAIKKAEKFIFIADWSFHPYARLLHRPPKKEGEPLDVNDSVGALLIKKAKDNPKMVIAIHTWDHTAIAAKDSQNDHAHDRLDDIAAALDGKGTKRPKNLLFKASSRTGIGYSHHQKYVILDCDAENDLRPETEENKGKPKRKEVKVFFGGLDLTKGRFDWWAHPIMPDSDECKAFRDSFKGGDVEYDDWYNAEFKDDRKNVRQPWHDIHAQLTGPTARDFVREFIGRWNLDPSAVGARGNTSKADAKQVNDVMPAIRDKDQFVQRLEPREPKEGGGFTGQVYRSIAKAHWGTVDPKEMDAKAEAANKAGSEVSKARMALNLKLVGAEPSADDPDVAKLKKLEKEFEDKQAVVEDAPYFGAEGFCWRIPWGSESSIQAAYISAIRKAQRFLYIESQYLIGSGAGWNRESVRNKIPETIVKKISDKISRGEDFHAYLIIPMFPEGSPQDGALEVVRHFEWATMRYVVYSIKDAIRKNSAALSKVGKSKAKWQDYISFYFLARWENTKSLTVGSWNRPDKVRNNQRYMIYVHSKLMIADDFYVILGSANLNERSLAGDRDTEICCGLTPDDQDGADKVKKFRKKLWSEVMGNGKGRAEPAEDWDKPETLACVEAVRAAASANYRAFRAGKFKDEGFLCRYEFDLDDNNNLVFSQPKADKDDLLPTADGTTSWDTVPDVTSDGAPMVVTPELKWDAGWGWTDLKSKFTEKVLSEAGE